MKKLAVGVLAAAFVLSAGTINAMAAGGCRGLGYHNGTCNYAGSCVSYTDENGDGICDSCGKNMADCTGRYFVDENGDGVCDYYAENTHHHSGAGNGWGHGSGHHR